MKRGSDTARRGGFTLLEMLIAVMLIAVFMLVSAQLFTSCLKTMSGANKATAAVIRLDAAMGQLRRDVWNARQCDADGIVLRIQPAAAGGAVIEWRVAMTGHDVELTRECARQAGPPDVRRWTDLSGPMTFAVRGPLVVVQAPDGMGKPTALVLGSQLQLAGGKP